MDGLTNLKNKLKNCEKIYGSTLLHFGFTGVPAIYKRNGADFLIVDMEHGTFFPENVGDLCYASRKEDLPMIARVQDCEYHCISKCIDMGCDGVIILVGDDYIGKFDNFIGYCINNTSFD